MKWRAKAIAPAFVFAFAAAGNAGGVGLGDADVTRARTTSTATRRASGSPRRTRRRQDQARAPRGVASYASTLLVGAGRCDGNYPLTCGATPAPPACGQRSTCRSPSARTTLRAMRDVTSLSVGDRRAATDALGRDPRVPLPGRPGRRPAGRPPGAADLRRQPRRRRVGRDRGPARGRTGLRQPARLRHHQPRPGQGGALQRRLPRGQPDVRRHPARPHRAPHRDQGGAPGLAALAAGGRAARAHPLPQAGDAGLHRQGGPEAARAHRDDRAGLLDDLAASNGPVDLVEQYCALLPVTVIAEILGVPEADRERVLAFGAAAAPSLDFGLSWKQFRRVDDGLRAFDSWLDAHIARLHERARRRPAQPAGARPRRGGHPRRRRAQVNRRTGPRRRLRDHRQPAGQRDLAAARAPRAARAPPRRPRPVAQRGRRGAPPRPAGAVHRPVHRARLRRSPARTSRPASACSPCSPAPTATPRSSRTRRPSTSPGPTPATTSPSPAAGTSASARRWPGWRARWACARSSTATPTSSCCPAPTAARPACSAGWETLPARLKA